jgi:hypothetical protein
MIRNGTESKRKAQRSLAMVVFDREAKSQHFDSQDGNWKAFISCFEKFL